MSWSIIARDSATGVGAVATQALVNPYYGIACGGVDCFVARAPRNEGGS